MDLELLSQLPPAKWPENAEEVICKVLVAYDLPLSERIQAVRLLGNEYVLSDTSATLLLSIINDSHEPVELRCEAVMSLGPVFELQHILVTINPEDNLLSEGLLRCIRQVFEELFWDEDVPDAVRRSILEISVLSPMAWHRDAIIAAYAVSDEHWKKVAVSGMNHVSGFQREILESLTSDNDEICCEAIYAAAKWDIHEAWPYLEEFLNAQNTPVDIKIAAIDAAAILNPIEAKPLIEELSHSINTKLANVADELLANISAEYQYLEHINDPDDDEEDEYN